jgi:hypothetical protein
VPHPKKFRLVVAKNPTDTLQKAVDRLTRLDEAGDHARLLEAVEVFLRAVVPNSYLAETFTKRFRSWEFWQVPDLAEAFKVKRTRDPRTIKAKRREMNLAWEILSFLTNCKRRDVAHKAAVKQAAKKFGVGVSTVDNIYRDNPDLRTIIENTPTWMFYERGKK